MNNLSEKNYNSDIIMNELEKEFKEIDSDILRFLNDSFNSNCADIDLKSLKLGYALENMNLDFFSNKKCLPEYLFLKVKSYLLEELLCYLLLFSDINESNYTETITEATASVILNIKNIDSKSYKSFNNALETNDLDEENNELMKKLAYINNHFNSSECQTLDNSSPYVYFNKVISSTFNIDFFIKDLSFQYKRFDDIKDEIPLTYKEYIPLLTYLFFKNRKKITASNNIIFKSSNLLLKLLNGNTTHPNYEAAKELINIYNEHITMIDKTSHLIPDNHSRKYVYYHLFNNYYHNEFFNSYNHPVIKTLVRKISIKELYNETKNELSWHEIKQDEITIEGKSLVKEFAIRDNMYYLRLITLLMNFDIDFNYIDDNDWFVLNGNIETIYSIKEGKQKELHLFSSNKYNMLYEQKTIFDCTLKFIHQFLDSSITYITDALFPIIKNIERIDQENNCDVPFNHAIEFITNELNNIYKNISIHNFKKIDDDELINYLVYDNYLLTLYLIKNGFIK